MWTSWGTSSKEEETLLRANQLGLRPHHQKGGKWWLRRYDRRRVKEPKSCLSCEDNGWSGKPWREEYSRSRRRRKSWREQWQMEVYHQSYQWCAPIFEKSPPMIWARTQPVPSVPSQRLSWPGIGRCLSISDSNGSFHQRSQPPPDMMGVFIWRGLCAQHTPLLN